MSSALLSVVVPLDLPDAVAFPLPMFNCFPASAPCPSSCLCHIQLLAFMHFDADAAAAECAAANMKLTKRSSMDDPVAIVHAADHLQVDCQPHNLGSDMADE